MKLCIDCRYFSPVAGASNDGSCQSDRPEREREKSKVTGSTGYKWHFCSTLRAEGEGRCGPDAAWFEPKENPDV